MTELGFEYKVMARRKGGRWEPWTGVWKYDKEMTLEKVRKFMRERWKTPENYNGLEYGIFRRMMCENEGKPIREKWGLVKVLSRLKQ